MKELWDILDNNGNKTGKTVERGNPMNQDEYHLVVHIWIKNDKGQYLITKRTLNRTFSNMWQTTGGSAISRESSQQAALREVKEETGLELSLDKGKILFRLKRQHADFPDFVDVWFFYENIDINKVIVQQEEICGAKWSYPEEILSMINKGEFVSVYPYLDEMFKIGRENQTLV